jgi:hypothetical protein
LAALSVCVLAVIPGCRSANKVNLDPLTDKTNPAASDPLRGGGTKPAGAAMPAGQARLLAPELGGKNEGVADAPSPTLGGPSTAALASHARIGLEIPRGAVKARMEEGSKNAVWTPSSSAITWDQAREILKDRGASWSPPEMRSDGLWYFRCVIPNPENPSLSRVYEASDTSDLGAVRKTLASIGS